MINFKKLKFKNFGSFGNSLTEIDFTENNLILVSGLNGRGKSFAYLDAITFALYGKPFRKINIPQLVNTINGKNCLVELEFSIGSSTFKIRRGLSPKLFEIYKNDVLIDQNAKSKDYQLLLDEQILKMNYKTFTQVVILGRSSFVPFLQLSPADRRQIIENILDINVFSNMNQIAKAKVSLLKENINDIQKKIETTEEKIQYQEKYILKLEEQRNSSKTKTEEKMDTLKKEIKTLIESIKSLKESVHDGIGEDSLDNLRDKKSSLNSEKNTVVNKITSAQKNLDFYEDNENCPVCKQSIDSHFRENKISESSSSIQTFETELDGIKKTIEECEAEIKEVSDKHKENQKIQEQYSINMKVLQNYQKEYEELEKELSKEPENQEELEKETQDLHDLNIVLESQKQSFEDFKLQKKEYDICVSLLKDGGIKSKIIKHYLPLINRVINTFLTNMNFFTNFELNEEFEEIIKSRHRDKFSYMSFSEGEKLRIDLALLFAWREVARVKNSANCNLLILDEIFDSSLDSTGTEELMRNLKTLKKNGSVIVISHKLDQLADRFDKTVLVEKKNNFSSIKIK